METRDRGIERKILAGFFVALLLLAADGVIALRSIRLYTERTSQQAQTFALLHTLMETVATVTAAETAVRGYLLTGDPGRLRAYPEGVLRSRPVG